MIVIVLNPYVQHFRLNRANGTMKCLSLRAVLCKLDGEFNLFSVRISKNFICNFYRAQKESHFLSNDGYGIGDDLFSVSFDGCRRLVWHNAKSMPISLPTWKGGSVCGCYIDLDTNQVIFSLDGVEGGILEDIFSDSG